MENIRAELMKAESLLQVRDILTRDGQELTEEEIDRVWQELEHHRVNYCREMSMEEFESVAGGARDHTKEGCAATCEMTSWCWASDYCVLISVTYSNWPERNGEVGKNEGRRKRFWR